jgi:hypothetical protein
VHQQRSILCSDIHTRTDRIQAIETEISSEPYHQEGDDQCGGARVTLFAVHEYLMIISTANRKEEK